MYTNLAATTGEGVNFDPSQMNKSSVINLQNELMGAGYDLPNYGADGDWGSETQGAYDQWLAKHNAPPVNNNPTVANNNVQPGVQNDPNNPTPTNGNLVNAANNTPSYSGFSDKNTLGNQWFDKGDIGTGQNLKRFGQQIGGMLGFANKTSNPAATDGTQPTNTTSVDGQAQNAVAEADKVKTEASPQLNWNSPQYSNFNLY